MRHTDIIQVDRAYHKAVRIIDRLLAQNKELENKLQALRNRPIPDDSIFTSGRFKFTAPPIQKNILKDPIEKWKANHFLRYFQQLFETKYGEEYPIRGKSWQAYGSRVKQFMATHPEVQKPEDFQSYMEWTFLQKFNDRFIASIPLLANEGMLVQWKINVKSSVNFDDLVENNPRPKSKKSVQDLLKEAF